MSEMKKQIEVIFMSGHKGVPPRLVVDEDTFCNEKNLRQLGPWNMRYDDPVYLVSDTKYRNFLEMRKRGLTLDVCELFLMYSHENCQKMIDSRSPIRLVSSWAWKNHYRLFLPDGLYRWWFIFKYGNSRPNDPTEEDIFRDVDVAENKQSLIVKSFEPPEPTISPTPQPISKTSQVPEPVIHNLDVNITSDKPVLIRKGYKIE